jgi:hypothetical protein
MQKTDAARNGLTHKTDDHHRQQSMQTQLKLSDGMAAMAGALRCVARSSSA